VQTLVNEDENLKNCYNSAIEYSLLMLVTFVLRKNVVMQVTILKNIRQSWSFSNFLLEIPVN